MKGTGLSIVMALGLGLFGINAAQATVLTLDFETVGTGRNLPTASLTTSIGTISASVSGGTLATHDISSSTGMSGQSLEHQQGREPDYAQLAFDFDVSSITFLYAGNVLGQFLAQVLDASLGVLDAYYDGDTEFDLPGGPVTLSGVGIRYFRFLDPDFYYGWAVIDDVTITAAAPEPATLALFGLGLASIGAVRRKKLAA